MRSFKNRTRFQATPALIPTIGFLVAKTRAASVESTACRWCFEGGFGTRFRECLPGPQGGPLCWSMSTDAAAGLLLLPPNFHDQELLRQLLSLRTPATFAQTSALTTEIFARSLKRRHGILAACIRASRITVTLVLLISLSCPLLEMFDHWDDTINRDDTEYGLVVLALCWKWVFICAISILDALY